MQINIQPYDSRYDEQLLELEAESVQGGGVKIKMIKPSVSARAQVFDNFQILMALDENRKIAGLLSAAHTEIMVNEQVHYPFCMFDARVGMKYRGNRLAHSMIQELLHKYNQFKTKDFFVTLKSNNKEVLSNINKDYKTLSQAGFVYLTIPTSIQVRKLRAGTIPDFRIVKFKSKTNSDDKLFHKYDSLSIWNTYIMYNLQLVAMPFLFNTLIKMHNALRPRNKYPAKNSIIKMASLYDYDILKLTDLNRAIKDLAENNVDYLNACCRKGDYLYNTLKPCSISSYDYLMVGTIPIKENDLIQIDVRCI